MNKIEDFKEFIQKRKKKKKKKKIYPPVVHSVGPLNMSDMVVTDQVIT
jgi:hypothetical protein